MGKITGQTQQRHWVPMAIAYGALGCFDACMGVCSGYHPKLNNKYTKSLDQLFYLKDRI